MNKNNIFWSATAKKVLQGGLLSYSFTLGQAMQGGGAALDLAKLPLKGWTPRLSYAIAVGMGVVTFDSIYQYLKTGQMPQDMQDLVRPRTGGTDPSTGKPERATLPMFANSFRNFWDNPSQEMFNKINPLWQTIIEGATNRDWKNQPIYDRNEPVTQQLEQLGRFAVGELGTPITFSSIGQAKEGTKISNLERLFGIRAAGLKDTDPRAPEGYHHLQRRGMKSASPTSTNCAPPRA